MLVKKNVLIVVVLMVQFKLIGQTIHPANTPAFLQNEVASIKITIAPANLAMLLGPDSLEANFEYPATFIYQSATISDTVYNVGFRLRGNTSRYSAKKSFKVSSINFLLSDLGAVISIEGNNSPDVPNNPLVPEVPLIPDIPEVGNI